MKSTIRNIILSADWTAKNLEKLLALRGDEQKELLKLGGDCLLKGRGNEVYYRGLVEFSNICTKDCFYCGIRKSNRNTARYDLSDDAVLEAARFAHEHRYGSLVLQAGERDDLVFVERIDQLLKKIKAATNGELGITLSLGEQTAETYRRWFESGAHRYLLRIETSDEMLYHQLHPNDDKHNFEKRLQCLKDLQKVGYQTGTGVMIGLPGQTLTHLAADLLFMKNFDIDMVGMGPYIEHEETPLYSEKNVLWPIQERFLISLNMVALLRLMMPDINIAATTAMQAIDPVGREKAMQAGANVIMPNITPSNQRRNYLLYQNKPCTDEGADDCSNCLSIRLEMIGRVPGYDQWGDSEHFFRRTKS
ncbi:[FeFe] hydrogenase H-cluster radical SAM maturase HydE [Marinilabilia sp.]|uniref:[FeFe] hydrogenase H-cluster radical SAM maturase HydE n=1 Tax=Marinilabilia sp. TaxID=2021252 RepID=UPI0025B7BD77|nr:[FeFe] hydrogenase H-cluster radical SAM maturase HydE [Marinilabilia sp.]